MKKSLLVFVLLGSVQIVFACGSGPTSVTWKNWSIKSNEMRWLGVSHNGMPLHHLVDGDPNTAWVWSGLGGRVDRFRNGIKELLFVRDTLFEVDEVRILSGYNKSTALWKRNNRIKTVRITRDGDQGSTWGSVPISIKTVSLRDSREWHRISLPRRKVSSIGLTVLGEYRGRDNDLCVSEIAFYNRGRQVNFAMPRVVALLDGFQDVAMVDDYEAIKEQPQKKTSFPDGLVDRTSGRVLNPLHSENPFAFSPDGKFVCAVNDDAPTGYATAQIFNVVSGRQLWRRNFRSSPNYPQLSWQSARRLRIEWSPKKQKPLPVRFVQF